MDPDTSVIALKHLFELTPGWGRMTTGKFNKELSLGPVTAAAISPHDPVLLKFIQWAHVYLFKSNSYVDIKHCYTVTFEELFKIFVSRFFRTHDSDQQAIEADLVFCKFNEKKGEREFQIVYNELAVVSTGLCQLADLDMAEMRSLFGADEENWWDAILATNDSFGRRVWCYFLGWIKLTQMELSYRADSDKASRLRKFDNMVRTTSTSWCYSQPWCRGFTAVIQRWRIQASEPTAQDSAERLMQSFNLDRSAQGVSQTSRAGALVTSTESELYQDLQKYKGQYSATLSENDRLRTELERSNVQLAEALSMIDELKNSYSLCLAAAEKRANNAEQRANNAEQRTAAVERLAKNQAQSVLHQNTMWPRDEWTGRSTGASSMMGGDTSGLAATPGMSRTTLHRRQLLPQGSSPLSRNSGAPSMLDGDQLGHSGPTTEGSTLTMSQITEDLVAIVPQDEDSIIQLSDLPTEGVDVNTVNSMIGGDQ